MLPPWTPAPAVVKASQSSLKWLSLLFFSSFTIWPMIRCQPQTICCHCAQLHKKITSDVQNRKTSASASAAAKNSRSENIDLQNRSTPISRRSREGRTGLIETKRSLGKSDEWWWQCLEIVFSIRRLFLRLLPKPHTYFNVRLIDGAARIVSYRQCRNRESNSHQFCWTSLRYLIQDTLPTELPRPWLLRRLMNLAAQLS